MKKFYTKAITGFFLFFLSFVPAHATHIVGGEVSYKCLGNNWYEFTVKIFRDCSVATGLDNPAAFTIFNANNVVVGSRSVFLTSDTVIPIINDNPCLVIPPNICVEQGTYVFTDSLPPSPGGYTVVYQRCCRNNSIVNINNPGAVGATDVAVINDSAYALCNTSPVFKSYPPIVICNQIPLIFDHSAFDADGDSLVYNLCQPYLGATSNSPQPGAGQASPPPYTGVPYVSPYTVDNPMGGSPPLTIDPQTGLLIVKPTALGQFDVGICVDEYRHGVYLGTHRRDFQFNVVACQSSAVAAIPPVIDVCNSDTVHFQNYSVGGNIYHWDFGVEGRTDDTSNVQFPTYVFPDTGVYHISLVVYNSTAHCGDSAKSTVYIFPTLKAKITTPDGCTGRAINFTDNSVSTYGQINRWNWNFGDSKNSTDQNTTHTYPTSGSYKISLIVGTNKGCTDTISQTITVQTTPTVIIQSLINNCSSYTINFKNFTQGAYTYHWDFDVADSTSDTSNLKAPTYTFPDTGIYHVRLTATNGLCSSFAICTVYVFPYVVAGAITPNGCVRNLIAFTDTSTTNFGSINNWKWNFGNGDSSALKNPSHAYSTEGTYPVTLIIKSSKGCVDTLSKSIIIHPDPVASIPASISNCHDMGVLFQNLSTGASIYHWDFGVANASNDTSNLQMPAFIFPDTGTYRVKLIVSNGFCVDSAICLVYIYPALTAGIVTPNGCINNNIAFMDTSVSNFGTINSWKWNFDNGDTSILKNPTELFDSAGNYTISLIVRNSLGCTDSIKKTILIYSFPTVTASTPDSIICPLDSVRLFGTIAGGGVSYVWSPNYNLNSTSIQNPVAKPKKTTTYYFAATDTYGCVGHDSVSIIFYDSVYARAGNDTLICVGGSVKLNGSGGGSQFSWSPATYLSSTNVFNPLSTPLANITYTLTESAGSCVATDAVAIIVRPYPTVSVNPNQTICEGDTTTLTASGCTSYSWSPVEDLATPLKASTQAYPTETTTYYVTGEDSTKCPTGVTDSTIVFVNHPDQINIMKDSTIIYGTIAQLWVNGGISYQWYPAINISNPNIANPVANPTVTTTYYVKVTFPNGCESVDSVVIKINYEPIVQIPSAFSPNGDNKNDYFRPIVVGVVSGVDFKVFNRWGQMIYHSSNATDKGWDGTFNGVPQQVGVYDYYFEAVGAQTGTPFKKKGNITLLR